MKLLVWALLRLTLYSLPPNQKNKNKNDNRPIYVVQRLAKMYMSVASRLRRAISSGSVRTVHRAPFRREGLRAKGMEVVRDVLAHVFREYIYHVSTYSTKNNGSLTKTRT